MDPMTIATLSATIMGLICDFRQERKDRKDLTRREFTDWLEARDRDDLKEFIIRSAELPSEIDTLLKKDMDELLATAGQMRTALSSLPERVDELAQTIQTAQTQSDRLKMLFILIEKQEKNIVSLESQGFFLPRNSAESEWELPIEVSALEEYYNLFQSIEVEDNKEWRFLKHEDAFHKEYVHVKRGNRLAKRMSLLKALRKLIEYREELDYLDKKTRTTK